MNRGESHCDVFTMQLVVLSPDKYCVKAQVCLKSETVIK